MFSKTRRMTHRFQGSKAHCRKKLCPRLFEQKNVLRRLASEEHKTPSPRLRIPPSSILRISKPQEEHHVVSLTIVKNNERATPFGANLKTPKQTWILRLSKTRGQTYNTHPSHTKLSQGRVFALTPALTLSNERLTWDFINQNRRIIRVCCMRRICSRSC